MIDEEERMLKTAENEVERQVFSMSSRDTNSTVSSKRAVTTKRERPPTKEALTAKTYDVYNTVLPPHSALRDSMQ